ncbi:hypothetical protein PMI04_014935 [Sphingobium sp. AP49]|uniref:hypothetical protein n=1 Tax=Sphingobium sp. AP49 TaxID=1144307 RepID=UPI00026EE72A|nr:hypothetical protein [Sphingobium sp. AP49]WHO37854.1 hypothetical protein PMI04_014935 [Sphingobium sp. AP49]
MSKPSIPEGWHPLSHMPVGDHRFIVVDYIGAEGQVARGYWSGHEYARAPINHRWHEPLPFKPVALRHIPSQGETQFATPAELRLAHAIVDSDPVLRVFAAVEWDCLGDDGKQWIAVIIREAQRLAKPPPDHAHSADCGSFRIAAPGPCDCGYGLCE